jgi:hypothetical protein
MNRHNDTYLRKRLLMRCAVFGLTMACWHPALAIVSDRYLTGVHTFDCDGEWGDTKAGSQPFRLVMKARESVIRIEVAGAQEAASPYHIAEDAIRFVAHLPATDGTQCVLYLPAGSLSYQRTDNAHAGQFIGLCLPEL